MTSRFRDLMPPRCWPGAGLLALFVVFLCLYTVHNQYPYFYHTDEPGKVAQLVNGKRDFHHPQLMLVATEVFGWVLGVERTPQRLVEMGRWYSAVCSALAVTGMVLLTARHGGWMAGALAGIVAGLHPLLFELSHYMKEDCGLLLGIISTLLALDWFFEKPSIRSALLVGGLAGLAVSAKYVGLLISGVALAGIVISSVREGWKVGAARAAAFLCMAVAVFGVINAKALLAPEKALVGVGGEFRQMDAMAEKSSLIQTNYFVKIPRKIAPPVLIGAVGYLLAFALVPRRRSPIGWALLSFAAIYLLAIHFTPLAKDRYLLPVLMLMYVMAAMAGCMLFEEAQRRRWNRSVFPASLGLAVLLVLGMQLPRVITYAKEFGGDSRVEMAQWIRQNLPMEAVVAYDAVVGFNKSKSRTDLLAIPQQTVKAKRFVSELGSLDEMRESGITHVVVAEYAWGNVFKRKERRESRHRERRQVYEELFEQGELLWERERGRLLYIHPGLRVYALSSP